MAAGAAGMAAVGGLAYFAYQAFQSSSPQGPSMGYVPPTQALAPVPYYLQEQQRKADAASAAPVAPPDRATAVLLIRAMIAAANADGTIDAEERQEIVDHLAEVGLGPAERQALDAELARPFPPSALVAEVRTPALAEQVYAVSVLAIDPDTEAERAYLRGLAAMLGLSSDVAQRIEAQLAAPT